jgi:hypothetical protein
MSFWTCQKDKTRCTRARNVFLYLPKRQNKPRLGSKCLFEAVKRTKHAASRPEILFESVKRTKHAASEPEMSFWTCQKDKTRCIRARNVFLNLPKGQNTLHPGPKCLFEAVKRTKHAVSKPKMSFWNRQKDKTRCTRARNVFLNLPTRQNTLHPGSKCPFEPAKKTKQAAPRLEMSFWTGQKDKTRCIRARNVFLNRPKGQTRCTRARNVFLNLPKRQNKLHPGPKCLFEAVKKTKHTVSRLEMSFWTCQKDKTSCTRVRNVFLNLPKRQNTLHPGPKCLFEAVKKTKHGASEPEMSFWTGQKDKTRCILARNVLLRQNTARMLTALAKI